MFVGRGLFTTGCSALRDQKRASAPPRVGITGGCDLPCGFWEQHSGLLQEHCVLLTSYLSSLNSYI